MRRREPGGHRGGAVHPDWPGWVPHGAVRMVWTQVGWGKSSAEESRDLRGFQEKRGGDKLGLNHVA